MPRSLLVVTLLLAAVGPAAAQNNPSGGLLVAYRAHAGERPNLEAGYRRHLDWHAANADSLTWHAWNVLSGPGMGLFVDGTFGKPFAALDVRVDPAGDERDAATNIRPFAESVFRELVLLRAELSTATPLETGAPTRLVQVLRYTSSPESSQQLRTAFAALRWQNSSRSLLPYTVYECVTCSGGISLMLMIWRDGFGSFDDRSRNPDYVLNELLAAQPVRGAFAATTELWLYRADLHYSGTARGDR
jgi:hypothetical protein